MRPRRIGLVGAAWRAPLTATGAIRPWPVSLFPATFGVRRTFRDFPGDFAAAPSPPL